MKIFRLIAAGLLLPFAGPRLFAQEDSSSVESTIDLWGRWRDGFEKFESAEQAVEIRNFPEALKLYTASRNAFESVRALNPDWQKSVIGYRIDLCSRKIESLKKYAGKVPRTIKRVPQQSNTQSLSAGQIARLKSQLAAAGDEIDALRKKADANAKAASQMAGLIAEKNDLLKKQASMRVLLDDARAQLAKKAANDAAEAIAVSERKRADELDKKLSELESARKKEREAASRMSVQKIQAENALRAAYARLTELTAVSSRIVQLEKNAKELTVQNSSLKKDREVLAKAAESAAKELENLKKQILSMKSELADVRKKADSAKAGADAALENLRKENASLRSTVSTMEKKCALLDTLRKTNSSLESRISEAKKRVAELEKAGNTDKSLKKANSELLAALESEKRKVSGLEKCLRMENNVKKINAELNSEIAFLRKKNLALEKTAAKLAKSEKDCAFLRKTTEEMRADLTEVRRRASEYAAANGILEKSAAHARNLEKETSALRAEFAFAKSSMQEAGKKLVSLTQENTESARKLAESGKRVSELEKSLREAGKSEVEKAGISKKLAEARKSLAALSSDNAKLRAEIGKLRPELEKTLKKAEKLSSANPSGKPVLPLPVPVSAGREEISKLQNQISVLKSTLLAREKERDVLLEKIKKAPVSVQTKTIVKQDEALLKRRENEISALKTELERMRKSDSVKGLRAEIATLTAAVSELKEGRSQYESALRNMTAKNTALTKKIEELNIALSNSKIETDAARKALRRGLPQGELERKNNELSESAAKFEKLYRETGKTLSERTEHVRKLEAELAVLRKKAGDSEIAANRLGSELKAWRKNGGSVAEDVKAKDEALSESLREQEESKKEIAVLRAELSMANGQIRRYRGEFLSLRRKLKVSQDEIRNLKMLNPRKYLEMEYKRRSAGAVPSGTASQTEKSVSGSVVKSVSKSVGPLSKANGNTVAQKKFESAMKFASDSEKSGDFAGALMNYWRAVEARPESAQAYAGVARSYLARKERSSAAKAYEKAIKLGLPRNAEFEKKLKD